MRASRRTSKFRPWKLRAYFAFEDEEIARAFANKRLWRSQKTKKRPPLPGPLFLRSAPESYAASSCSKVERLHTTTWRELGNSIAWRRSMSVNARETVSIVSPR